MTIPYTSRHTSRGERCLMGPVIPSSHEVNLDVYRDGIHQAGMKNNNFRKHASSKYSKDFPFQVFVG